MNPEKPEYRTPTTTCRLQFHRGFRLADATGIVDVLASMGISHVYASPLLRARPGSTHGYDVVDPSVLNPELGTEEDLERFVMKLRERGMGLILDVVPNHMCIADPLDAWWFDVLENGPGSPYAKFFDIDWVPPKEELENRVLLPVLGDQYGAVLERGEITIRCESGAFEARYYDQRFPVAPKSWPAILEPVLARLRESHAESHETVVELESVLHALSHLPPRTETDPLKVRERQREKLVIRKRLAALMESRPPVADAIRADLAILNGKPGASSSFDRLDSLLANQGYRLSNWRVAADEINYRRFFDVNELAAIRVELPEVFRAVHSRLLDWVARGWIDGLRIDHVDGLLDPAGYLAQLRAACTDAGVSPMWIVVEKIFGPGESIPLDWPVQGTTGYDFLNDLNGLFVHAEGYQELCDGYAKLVGPLPPVREQVATCRKLIMLVSLAAELHVLARRLDRISEQRRESRDFTRESLRFGLRESVARLPVYRTYARGLDAVGAADRKRVEEAVEEAKRSNPATSPSLWDFIRGVWTGSLPPGLTEEHRARRADFVLKLQQFTGPVAAKGVEDTHYYRYAPLASLNEVGADPEAPVVSPEEFHARNARRAAEAPATMTATSTHDTKRSEDARAALNVLSEMPGEWFEAVRRWRAMNAPFRTSVDRVRTPGPAEELAFYQALVATREPARGGASEDYVARIEGYLLKSVREAKLRTSWISPRESYETAVARFVREALRPTHGFLADFDAFMVPVHRAGLLNSIAQVVLKVASPGVPDFYQGTEVWFRRLVDPDNRQPANWARTRELLSSLDGADVSLPRLLESADDGRLKLFVTRAALRLRKERCRLFAAGDYAAVGAPGPLGAHVVALARSLGSEAVLAVAGRHLVRMGKGLPPPAGEWGDLSLELPAGLHGRRFRCALSGRSLAAAGGRLLLRDALDPLPVALLEAL